MKHKAHGFTIVELLIVIVIIAILAAITLVAYNGITNRSKIARMQSDYNSISKALGMYIAEQGSSPICPSGTTACNFSTITPVLAPYATGLPTKLNDNSDILYAATPANTTGWAVRMKLPDGTYCRQGMNADGSWWSPISACW